MTTPRGGLVHPHRDTLSTSPGSVSPAWTRTIVGAVVRAITYPVSFIHSKVNTADSVTTDRGVDPATLNRVLPDLLDAHASGMQSELTGS